MKKEVLLKFRSRRAESLIDCGAAAAASLLSRAGHALYRRRRQLATAGVAVLAVLLGYHAIFGANGTVVYQQKKTEFRSLEKEVQQLQTENDQLAKDIRALKSDPKAIEKEAREQLRYAKPGEVVFLLPAPAQKDAPVSAQAAKP